MGLRALQIGLVRLGHILAPGGDVQGRGRVAAGAAEYKGYLQVPLTRCQGNGLLHVCILLQLRSGGRIFIDRLTLRRGQTDLHPALAGDQALLFQGEQIAELDLQVQGVLVGHLEGPVAAGDGGPGFLFKGVVQIKYVPCLDAVQQLLPGAVILIQRLGVLCWGGVLRRVRRLRGCRIPVGGSLIPDGLAVDHQRAVLPGADLRVPQGDAAGGQGQGHQSCQGQGAQALFQIVQRSSLFLSQNSCTTP